MNFHFEMTPAIAWLANYLLHSSSLLGGVWLAEKSGMLSSPRAREFAWRAALFGAILTASVHTFAPGVSLTGVASLPATPFTRAAPTLCLRVSLKYTMFAPFRLRRHCNRHRPLRRQHPAPAT